MRGIHYFDLRRGYVIVSLGGIFQPPRKAGQIVYAHHTKLDGLQPDSSYLYGAMHDGAEPEFATFRTSPRGRAPFTFTSFGDQGTPTLGKKYVPPAGVTMPNPPYVMYVNDNLGSPAA